MQRHQVTEDAENAFKRTRGHPPTRLKKKPLMNENRIAIKENDDKQDDVKALETNIKTEEDPPVLVSSLQSYKTSPASSDLHLPRTWLKVSCDSLITMKCPDDEGSEVPVRESPSPIEEKSTEMATKNADTFEAGTLVWAFMSGYPLWPAIITSNAEENTHIRQKKMKNCVVNFFHVQFFGDGGRHSWISKCRLLLFSNGQKGLEEMARYLEPSIVNNKKFMVALQLSVKGNRGGSWDVALKEAMACDQFKTPSERLEYFFSLIKKPCTERKRKLSMSGMQVVGERLKSPAEESKELNDTEEEHANPKSTKLPKKFRKETREICCGSCSQTFNADFDIDLSREDALCPQCILSCCFICKRNEATCLLEKCTLSDCIYSYHKECMASWPSATTRENGKESPCPMHYCHNCSRLWKQNVAEGELRQHKKLVRCVLCPAAFHNECLAAGCLRISSTKIICYRHGKSWKTPTPVHVNWCFTCSKGGKLLCCDRCPASFHLDCLNLPSEPYGAYLCEDCESGSAINMGDIVWVKIGYYRWWPARVPLVEEIPEHLAKMIAVPGEFLVRFYGSHDYAVVHRGQAFHYQEGDTGGKDTSKGSLAVRFQKAIEEAAVGYREREKLLNERSAVLASSVKTKPAPYKRIKSNQYVGKVRPPPEASSTPCDCKAEMPGPCGPNSSCINRLLLIECNPALCPAGEKCENQRLQKRQYPALHIFRTNSKGWGLKTSVDIKRGELVIEYVGEVIDELELKKRLKIRHEAREESFYFLTLDSNRVIDAGPKGNLARFMNHSCSPNCESQKWTVQGDTRIGLFALTDISAGTELTFNYQLECAVLEGEESRNKQPCLCGASNCSGFIGAKPKPIKENIVKENKVKAVKKKRKNPKQKKLEDAEDLCFSCGDGGDLILCDMLTCNKVYHLECLSLSAPPKGAWTCPWHHCDVCGKKSSVVCSVCPSSVCSKHADSLSVRDDPRFGQVCREHNEDFLATVMEDRQKRSGKTCQKV